LLVTGEPANPESSPSMLGRYRLHDLLGEGGMGSVFEAELQGPAGFRKRVALKVLTPGAKISERAAELLVREARLGGLLRHPHVVETYELGQADGRWFVAMELVRGPTLTNLVRRVGPLPPRAMFQLAHQVSIGLAHAHALEVNGAPAGLVHRDLKPANILLDNELGWAKVADFGIASLRQSVGLGKGPRGLVGTPPYMSPEHLGEGELTASSDVFALGAVLYFACRAERLIPARGFVAIAKAVMDVERRLDSVTAEAELAAPGLGAFLRRCLRCDPAERWASCAEMAKVAAECLAGAAGPGLGELLNTPSRVNVPRSLYTAKTAAATNLRSDIDTFFGRSDEVASIAAHFASGQRLLTVKGLGGLGKTRLARKFGLDQTAAWPGGVWFCDFTSATDESEVINAVGSVLGVALTGSERQIGDRVQDAIEGRGRVLLILDNFEQVADSAAQTLGNWLAGAPEACFLVTSRRVLGLQAEAVHELLPLTVDEGVALFCARASKSVDADETVREIVARLDCLPLAIELAAARVGLFSTTQLLARLSQRFRVLAGGGGDRPERHRTLRDTIDWSWQLLEPWERRALEELSVFAGGFFVEAADAVLDLSAWPEAPWAVDVVTSLWERSLLVSREHEGEPRFYMLESVRVFALERATSDAALRARFSVWFQQYGLPDRADHREPTWRSRLEKDVPNLVAAFEWAQEAGDSVAIGRLALGVSTISLVRGPHQLSLTLVQRALQNQGLPAPERMSLLRRLGYLANSLQDAAHSFSAYERAMVLAEEVGDRHALGLAEFGMATADFGSGDYSAALRRLQRSSQALLELGDHWSAANTLARMGALQWRIGQWDAAAATLRKASISAEKSHNLDVQAYLHIPLGVSTEADDVLAAFAHYRAATAKGKSLRNSKIELSGLINLGVGLIRNGRFEEGRDTLEKAAAFARRLGERRSVGIALGNVASALLDQERPADARRIYLRAMEIVRDRDALAYTSFAAGAALALGLLGDMEETREQLHEVARQLEELGVLEQLGQVYVSWARLEQRAGDVARATALVDLAETIANESQHPENTRLRRRIASAREGPE